MPAMLASTSRWPCRATVSTTSDSTNAGSVTSPTTSLGPSLATSTPTTVAPSSCSLSTVARPMPDAAPVTIATRPSKRCMAVRLERVLVLGELPPVGETSVSLLLHEDEHGAPRVAEPRRAQTGDRGDAGGEERDAAPFEVGPGLVDVVAHETRVRRSGVHDRRWRVGDAR